MNELGQIDILVNNAGITTFIILYIFRK
ncbi:hypothetical protein [Bacillus xiapuensis]